MAGCHTGDDRRTAAAGKPSTVDAGTACRTLHLLRGQIRLAGDGATSSGSAGKLLIVLGAWHTPKAGNNAAPLLTIAKPSPLSDPGT